MEEEDIARLNACTDLVSLRACEGFLSFLLGSKSPGEWVPVRESCSLLGVAMNDLGEGLFAAWLSDPTAEDGYAVILFYDDETKWSMAAHYNRARLLEGISAS